MKNLYPKQDATGLAAMVAGGDVSADELLDIALDRVAMAFGADEQLMSLSAQIEMAAPWAATQQSLLEKGGIATGA